jgi:hypothetical protein
MAMSEFHSNNSYVYLTYTQLSFAKTEQEWADILTASFMHTTEYICCLECHLDGNLHVHGSVMFLHVLPQ